MHLLRSLLGDQQGHSCRGPLVLGIRDVSRDLQFRSSYTVVENAPEAKRDSSLRSE